MSLYHSSEFRNAVRDAVANLDKFADTNIMLATPADVVDALCANLALLGCTASLRGVVVWLDGRIRQGTRLIQSGLLPVSEVGFSWPDNWRVGPTVKALRNGPARAKLCAQIALDRRHGPFSNCPLPKDIFQERMTRLFDAMLVHTGIAHVDEAIRTNYASTKRK